MTKVLTALTRHYVAMMIPFMLISLSFLLPVLFLSSELSAAESSGNAPSVEEVYEAVRKANTERFPPYFSAQLSSAVVRIQLKNIPPEMVEFGKKPKLYLHFKQQYSPRLILTNVESFYRNFFSPYEDTMSRSGLFLGIDGRGGYKQFIRNFEAAASKTSEGEVVIKVREREGLPGDYATYFFDKKWSILRVVFYEENEASTEIKFYYINKNGYRLPKRMLIYLKGESDLFPRAEQGGADDHLVIEFLNHGFKASKDIRIGQ